MKFSGGISQYEASTGKWIYSPRNYTDFHCTLKEWKNLNRGKTNLINQLLQYLAQQDFLECENKLIREETTGKFIFVPNKGYLKYDIDIDGDFSLSENFSNIIKYVIKYVTGLSCTASLYSWKTYVDHIVIEFSYTENKLPNIVILIDRGFCETANLEPIGIIITCLEAVYQTIKDLNYEKFDKYLKQYYNNNYDRIFNYSHKYSDYYGLYQWPDFYRLKEKRKQEYRADIKYE